MGTDIHGVWQCKVDGEWHDVASEYEQCRHYQLFAVLAGVRNGYGFAGTPTGEAVTPIAKPRGLPKDFILNPEDGCHPLSSPDHLDPWRREIREKYGDDGESLKMWMGDHSFSYLSGKEMLEYFESLPSITHCGGISGPGIVVIDESNQSKPHNWTHIRVYWRADLKEELSHFFDEVKRLTEKYGEIRFVFGFDS